MISFSLLAFAKFLAALMPGPGFSGSSIAASDAAELAANGKAVLIDIRRPDEWQATGRPQGSRGITLEDPDFVSKVKAVAGDAPIILICRSGRRSLAGMNLLQAAGMTEIAHIGEGMIGSDDGPGWLNRELPLDPFEGG